MELPRLARRWTTTATTTIMMTTTCHRHKFVSIATTTTTTCLLVVLMLLTNNPQATAFYRRAPVFGGIQTSNYMLARYRESYRRISTTQQIISVDPILKLRAGAGDGEKKEETEKDEEEEEQSVEAGDDDEDDDDEAVDQEEEDEDEQEEEDEAEEDEEKEEEKTKKSSGKASVAGVIGKYDEPMFPSPFANIYVTFGVMMLARRINLDNPIVVKICRILYIFYVIGLQLFLLYVRVKAKQANNRTLVTINNPLSGLLQNQLGSVAGGAGGGMVKALASSFLSSTTTILEYDLREANNMQRGILFNMALLWLLHFKMKQTQPVLLQTASGLLTLFYSPLFQVYVLGRNLERPFKTQTSAQMAALQEQQKEGAANVGDGSDPKIEVITETDAIADETPSVEADDEDEDEADIDVDDGDDDDDEEQNEDADVDVDEREANFNNDDQEDEMPNSKKDD